MYRKFRPSWMQLVARLRQFSRFTLRSDGIKFQQLQLVVKVHQHKTLRAQNHSYEACPPGLYYSRRRTPTPAHSQVFQTSPPTSCSLARILAFFSTRSVTACHSLAL